MPDWEAYQEAYKRGILPDDKKALYQEAMNRGLVPGIETQKPSLIQSIGQGVYRTAQNIGQVYPAVETGLNLLTSMYGVPLSGLAGLAGLPFGKGPEAVEAVQKATIYQPQTQRGQELTGATTYPFQKLGELGESTAEIVRETTGSPVIATVIGTGIQASPLLLGIKGKGAIKPQEIHPITKGTMVERIAEVIPPGSEFFKRHRTKLNELVNESNKQFTKETLNLPDPSMKAVVKETSQKLFKEMSEAVGGNNAPVNAPNLANWAKENYAGARLQNKMVSNAVEQIAKDIAEEGTTKFYNINNLQYFLSKKYKFAPGETEIYAGVKEAIKADLDLIGQAKGKPILEMYEKAMDAARMGHRFSETNFIESLIRKATRYDPDRQIQIFDPIKFKELIDANEGNLQTMFRKNPEIPQLIKGYSDKMMTVSRDLTKFSSQKPTTPAEWLQTGGGAALAVKTGLIIPWGAETALAYAISHPRGWLKRWVGSKTVSPVGPALTIMTEKQED